jgi:hypothetical protein
LYEQVIQLIHTRCDNIFVSHQKVFSLSVIDECRDRSEGGAALRAEEGALAGVDDHVDLALLSARERLRANLALERTVA